MTATDKNRRTLEPRLLPGEIFEAIHPAIDFNREKGLRAHVPLASRVVALLARPSRRDRGEPAQREVQ